MSGKYSNKPDTYRLRVEHAKSLVQYALERYKKPFVSCSFGKDSMVCLHLAMQFKKDIPVLFNNTLVEFPESYKFRDKIVKEWDLNFIETPLPKKNFWKCMKEYGLPTINNRRCCYYLKEKPTIECIEKNCLEISIAGLRKTESRTRMLSKMYNTQCSQLGGIARISPIYYWSESDVWRYINENHLPANPLYKMGYKRVGCWPCPVPYIYGNNKYFSLLKITHPKMYNFVWKMFKEMEIEKYSQNQTLGTLL